MEGPIKWFEPQQQSNIKYSHCILAPDPNLHCLHCFNIVLSQDSASDFKSQDEFIPRIAAHC